MFAPGCQVVGRVRGEFSPGCEVVGRVRVREEGVLTRVSGGWEGEGEGGGCSHLGVRWLGG